MTRGNTACDSKPSQAPPVQDKEERVQAMFSSIAHVYDLNNSLLSLGLHHRWKKKAAAIALLKPELSVLDLCTGTGDLAILLVERLKRHLHRADSWLNCRVIAMDLNEAMLQHGRKKIWRRGLDRWVRCLRGNAEAIPFCDGSFDLATVAFGIRNLAHAEQGLAEIHRVLRPGGQLVCLEFSQPTAPPLRILYHWYSFRLLPWIGTLVSGDRTGVYRYLPSSIRQFPDQERLKAIIQQVGFNRVEYTNLSGGIVAIHTAWR